MQGSAVFEHAQQEARFSPILRALIARLHQQGQLLKEIIPGQLRRAGRKHALLHELHVVPVGGMPLQPLLLRLEGALDVKAFEEPQRGELNGLEAERLRPAAAIWKS